MLMLPMETKVGFPFIQLTKTYSRYVMFDPRIVDGGEDSSRFVLTGYGCLISHCHNFRLGISVHRRF